VSAPAPVIVIIVVIVIVRLTRRGPRGWGLAIPISAASPAIVLVIVVIPVLVAAAIPGLPGVAPSIRIAALEGGPFVRAPVAATAIPIGVGFGSTEEYQQRHHRQRPGEDCSNEPTQHDDPSA
jgi:hypothetical protein